MGDEELWGEEKDKYTIADLERWLDLKDGVKGKVLKKGKKKAEKDVGKGKEKNETKKGKKRIHRKKE